MRKLLTVFLIFFSCLSFGQDYKLFNAGSKKLFTEFPDPLSTYSISFDTVVQSGSDSVYYNFLRLSDLYFESDTCQFWGGQNCFQQNLPSWTGKKIIYDNLSKSLFFNLSGDTLTFDFTNNVNDTLLFYKDSAQKFLFVYIKSDTTKVLGNLDSARFYKIIHTDLSGNIINSSLNQQNIIVAENWGLQRFFQIDSFPQVLRPLALIGNISPSAGLSAITNEMLYDYQPGDEIQYREYSHYYSAPPWWNYTRYRKLKFLNRVTTADSIIYTVSSFIFYVDSVQTYSDTAQLKFYRNNTLSQIPFEYFDGNTRRLYLNDYCGTDRWTYTIEPATSLGYCAADTCWGSIDTQGPPPQIEKTYVFGLGIYNDVEYIVSPTGYYRSNNIVYYKKNGLSCGTEAIVGIEDTLDINSM